MPTNAVFPLNLKYSWHFCEVTVYPCLGIMGLEHSLVGTSSCKEIGKYNLSSLVASALINKIFKYLFYAFVLTGMSYICLWVIQGQLPCKNVLNNGCLVTQSCPTLCDLMDCSLPGSSVHVGILQARTLEWVAIPFFSGSSQPRHWTLVSWSAGRFCTIWVTREALSCKNITIIKVTIYGALIYNK